jgi:hypothetical protein
MYEGNGEIPKFLKLTMAFIDRIGFPVLAFILMFYMSFVSITKVTCAVSENTKALTEFSVRSSELQKTMLINQGIIMTDMKTLMLKESRALQ